MSAPIAVPTAAKAPSWAARNAKFLWAGAGAALTVATDVVDYYSQVIPSGWLPAVQGVILVLTAIGVQRDTNLVGINEVVSLVAKVLPNHQLVPVPTSPPAGVVPVPAPAAPVEAPATTLVDTVVGTPYVPSADVLAKVGTATAAPVTTAAPVVIQ